MKDGGETVCKEDSRRLCRSCVGRAVCHLVRDQVSTGTGCARMLVCVSGNGGCVVLAGSC